MKKIVKAAIIGVAVITVVSATIGYGVKAAVENVVIRESIDKSQHWANYMAQRLPDLPGLLASGRPTQEQLQTIYEIREVGDIFRFKMFNDEGRLVLESSNLDVTDEMGIGETIDPEAVIVLRTGEPIVDVFDGTEKVDRPDLYAEAYIPLRNVIGAPIGVIEVYVDQTATRGYFADSFRSFGIMLMIFCAVIFAVPGGAFYVQRVFTRKSTRRAEFLARYDSLTGVMNRAEFVTQANGMLDKSDLSVLCFIDLDRFKSINDTHGHAAGDAFLVHVSRILREHCVPQDLIARFGGDEFVVAFDNLEMDDALKRVRSILKACAESIDYQMSQVSGTLSIGLTPVEQGKTLQDLLSNADAALYHVKATGRNDYAIYGEEMGEELRRRQATERRLREAAKTNDFEIHYQPLVDGAGQSLIGHEALLRLYDHDGTPIPPDNFIPVAEELGLIEGIGTWTIQTALKQMAARNDDLMLAINLSPVQFASGKLTQVVRDALTESGFSADRLELEITETLLLSDSEDVELQIDVLKEMGVSIAMDDFGTGFSSLSYLWKYGFDRLKIDRSFIMALDHHPERTQEIIETIIMLGTRLKIKVTAEGVETAGQSALLSQLGCDVLQGYHFGRPERLPSPQAAQTSAA